MEQQQVPKLATRVYSKKALGAYPEVDNNILHDPTATQPQERYLVLGEKFAGSLAAARALAADMLQVANRNTVTEVEYQPATGWHHTGGNHRKSKSDEGTIMNQATTPAEVQPTGKWLNAVNDLQKWVDDNNRPADTETEALGVWNKKHKQMQDRVTYHKGVALGTTKPRGMQKGAGAPRPGTSVRKNKTSTANPASASTPAMAAKSVFVNSKVDISASIKFNGVKMECDSIEGIFNAISMIKASVAK